MKKLWVISGALAGVIALCALGLWYKEKKTMKKNILHVVTI